MLTRLLLRNWRAHDETDVPLEPFTLIVGPNGAGKTCVLEALSAAWRLLGQPWHHVFAGTHEVGWIRRRGVEAPTEARIYRADETGTWTLTVVLANASGAPKATVAHGETDTERATNQRVLNLADVPALPGAESLGAVFEAQLDPHRLAEPAPEGGESPRLGPNGEGLASVLAEMKLNRTQDFDDLVAAAREIVPILRGVSFGRSRQTIPKPVIHRENGQEYWRVELEQVMTRELQLTFADAPALPAHAASEGTLLVLGVLTAMFAPERPRLILLDDIDRALHPRAQRLLADRLRRIRESFGMQIVATTHSPYLADAFEPGEVVVLLREGDGDGRVAAHRLSDHPDAGLLDALRTGEFWTARGERGWPTTPAPASTEARAQGKP